MPIRVTAAFPVVISGPSGAGKTTLVKEIIERDPLLRSSVSTTTREPRGKEKEGEAYFFVSREDFERLKSGELIEWAQVHDHFYGTPKEFLEEELSKGKDVVLNIDVQGGAKVKKAFPGSVLVFILPPSMKELEVRMKKRGTDLADEIARRLEAARDEIKDAELYDYIVENNDLEEAVGQLLAIIESERHRRIRYPRGYLDSFMTKE